MSRIAVIGTGYVGLTTGACFAKLGHEVVCTDKNGERVDQLQQGHIPILEAGLPEIVKEAVEGGRLSFSTSNTEAAAWCEFAYLCVPTPQGIDGSADLSYIEDAAKEIGPVLQPEAVVINKSTVPVGSTRVVERALGRSDVAVVSNPEFLREGSAVHDFLNPDRIVIGAEDQSAAVRVASLYIGVTAPLIVTDPASAETIKYAANAFLATKISFINAVAAVTEAVGADINDVVLGMGYDSRIGHEFLRPGPGWGGSCFVAGETLLVRRGETIRHLSFEELWPLVEGHGERGWEALSWRHGEPTPEFLPIGAFTRRPYEGDLVELTTTTGHQLTVTADHGVLVGDGVAGDRSERLPAAAVTTDHWVPLAQGFPIVPAPIETLDVLASAMAGGIAPEQLVVRLTDRQFRQALAQRAELSPNRRYDLPRTRSLRLSELRTLGIDPRGGRLSTATSGNFIPTDLPLDAATWRMLGRYLATGAIDGDGRRPRLTWSFGAGEDHLADELATYWKGHGVKVAVAPLAAGVQVSVCSRTLAAVFEHLGLGSGPADHALPDLVWSASEREKSVLLAELWDHLTGWRAEVSPRLRDGLLRLLGDLRIVVGTDGRPTHGQHRSLSKNASWVRVAATDRRPFAGDVYSIEVPTAHTVVTTGAFVTHQCFPKDSRALVRIAEDAGYEFDLLKGVISVNDEQFDRVAEKAVALVGGSVDGVRIAAWGLTFKARTDDLRESPSLEVLRRLAAQGALIRAYDPAVQRQLDGMEVVDDPYAACQDAEVLLVLTEWDEFKWLDLDKVAEVMASRRVVDGRNLLDRSALQRRGFSYRGIGRA